MRPPPGRTGFFVAALCLVTIAVDASSDTDIATQLPGVYDFVDINEMLNFTSPHAVLQDLICPKKVEVRNGSTAGVFPVKVGDSSQSESGPNLECYVENQQIVNAILSRGELNIDSANSSSSDLATTVELQAHYPLFYGNFSDRPMICPALNSTEDVTTLVAQDIGYIYSLVNEYKVSGIPLGQIFTELNRSSFEPFVGKYTISMTLDYLPGNEKGCEYILPDDKLELQRRISEALLADPTPTADPVQSISPQPTSPSRPTETPASEKKACFPGNVLVRLDNDSLIKMNELRVGQSVLDSAGHYSEVLLFTHSDSEANSEFVRIRTATAEVTLSPSHYLYVNSKLTPAEGARVGDFVHTVSGKDIERGRTEIIESIERVFRKGLFNPQTTSGDILLFSKENGVLASTYTKAIPPSIAHLLLAPLRLLHGSTGLTLPGLSQMFTEGNEFWPTLLEYMRDGFPVAEFYSIL